MNPQTDIWTIVIALAVVALVVWAVVAVVRRRRKAPAPPGTPRKGPSGFADLVEHDSLRTGLEALGWHDARPIQERTIDALRSGRDILVSAPQGTGKTGAYLVPALERQLHREGLHTLIV
ncbi:MAG TPA: DEAD/DEAH box helicase, partial [Longimicrobiales bacterium]|nr:DEAD/DEAH box helicase [Longimicrobiales bacterium]